MYIYKRRSRTHSLGSILDSEGSDGGGSDTRTAARTHARTPLAAAAAVEQRSGTGRVPPMTTMAAAVCNSPRDD